MKKFLLLATCTAMAAMGAKAQEITSLYEGQQEQPNTMQTMRKQRSLEDAYIVNGLGKNVIYVHEEVTTHIIMPENIKLVDISTKKIAGNQCADNIIRIKPIEKMFNNELAGTVTIIGERNMVQYDIIYTSFPTQAYSVYKVSNAELDKYTNPEVSMTTGEMARFAYSIYNSPKKFYGIKSEKYGIKIQVNNIYTLNDYFFIDFSLVNKSKIKYDIDEMRIKLTDKKQTKATNAQTVELTPRFKMNDSKSFIKAYRNVIVIDKLTFPNEKVLTLEISEKQISGRIISVNIDYSDILNADSFDESLYQKQW